MTPLIQHETSQRRESGNPNLSGLVDRVIRYVPPVRVILGNPDWRGYPPSNPHDTKLKQEAVAVAGWNGIVSPLSFDVRAPASLTTLGGVCEF